MEEDVANLKELLQLQHKYNSCGAYVVESHQQYPLDDNPAHPILFQRSASLSEQIIATYKQPVGTLPHPPPPP